MLTKEYRICMPLSVEEYKIGQLYMISRHSNEESDKGEGVEVIRNEACQHSDHGRGRYTEKRLYLNSKLPGWMRNLIPRFFYITEKAWNYYPYTITDYTCSFLPRFSVHIQTKYENNNGSSDNCHQLSEEELQNREVIFLDIVNDDLPEKYYKENEDLKKFHSKKTGRGPLSKNWKEETHHHPIMCSYKLVQARFEVWGFQGKVEQFSQKAIRDILLAGHRQAFAWIDEWYDMTVDDVRSYEQKMQDQTNEKVMSGISNLEEEGGVKVLESTISGSRDRANIKKSSSRDSDQEPRSSGSTKGAVEKQMSSHTNSSIDDVASSFDESFYTDLEFNPHATNENS